MKCETKAYFSASAGRRSRRQRARCAGITERQINGAAGTFFTLTGRASWESNEICFEKSRDIDKTKTETS
ncbi:hypothetical protein L596_000751 [Steinernema carpocapsae]|uniref:Uncharacterized protein n=1 Tax=Steinernema carpocapsae TaxID=34508 RepID=A0A4U8UJP6_STECR|nr:hypothetical protein L596_000751 [Steinernema carpocapsae]